MRFAICISIFVSCACFAGDWPQWLGPTRDCHGSSDTRPLEKLPAELKPIWKKNIGGGFSSLVTAKNTLVYFDEDGSHEIAHAIEAKTGKEIWHTPIGERYSDEWGAGPRSTPLIDGDRVYVQSCRGEFRCLNFRNGKILWGISFEKNFGVKFLGSKANEGTAARRGNNGTAVIEGEDIIVPVGSTDGGTLVCFNKLNGKIIWKSGTDEAAYSSPQIATLAGVKQVVYLSADSLSGFDRGNGKILWRVPMKTNAKRHAATPVIFGDTVIVNSHTFGLVAIKISRQGNEFSAAPCWENKKLKINLSTPVRVDDFLFSQGPTKNFICADARNGELKWEAPGFGEQNSSVIAIGKNLLALTDHGELFLVAAQSGSFKELGRAQVCGKNWNFPALADGKLFVRDARELICYELIP